MRMGRNVVVLGLIALLAWACEPSDADLAGGDKALLPDFLTAEDFDAVSVDAPGLCLTGTVDMAFERPGDTFGFAFSAAVGDTVTFATVGDDPLDTVLLLFGPMDEGGYYGRYPLVMDDDGGEGLLSQLVGYELKESGRFIVIVATYGGQGRGATALTVVLNGDNGCGTGGGGRESGSAARASTGRASCRWWSSRPTRARAATAIRSPSTSAGKRRLPAISAAS